MKAISFRILVLLASFVTGVGAAYVAREIDSLTGKADLVIWRVERGFTSPPTLYPVGENGSIEVIAHTVSANDGRMIEFTVINRNIMPATYWSFSADDIHPALKHNGKDVFIYSCGTGQKPYTLAPGESLTFTIPESLFTRNSGTREGKFRAGFPLSFIQGNHVYYWSDDFKLDK